jgi:hypothetical protein
MPPPEPPHGYQVEGRNPYTEQRYYRQVKELHKLYDNVLERRSRLVLTTDRMRAYVRDWQWVDEQDALRNKIHDLNVLVLGMEATYPRWHFEDECSWRRWEANDENWHQLAFYNDESE